MREKSALNNSKNSEESILESYLQDISSAKPLSDEEEAKLSNQILAGDTKAKDQLIKANLKFVVSIARQYSNEHISILDLINEGNIALIKAADNFKSEFGKRFSNYAVWNIRKAIEAFIPQQSEKINRSNTEELVGFQPNTDHLAIDFTENQELSAIIDLLPEREKLVLKAYYGISTDHMTMAEIGMKYKISRERVRQTRDSALRNLNRLKKKNK